MVGNTIRPKRFLLTWKRPVVNVEKVPPVPVRTNGICAAQSEETLRMYESDMMGGLYALFSYNLILKPNGRREEFPHRVKGVQNDAFLTVYYSKRIPL